MAFRAPICPLAQSVGRGLGKIMSVDEENPLLFITGSRHAGLTLLTSIQGYSKVLQQEMSVTHQKALQVILDCCEIPWASWISLTRIIEQNDHEKAIEILSQVDGTGQSYLEQNFINKSLASLEIAKKESGGILEQAQQLTDDQRFFIEIIDENCEREIEVWKEIALYFS
jgi:hypothetical protein